MSTAIEELRRAAGRWGQSLTTVQEGLLMAYADDVRQAGERVNLTAESGSDGLLLRHMADGLAAVPVLKSLLRAERPRLLDLGSGAGFIGVAVKIAWPEAEVTLMEPVRRKYDFLNAAAARLGCRGLRVERRSAGRASPASSRRFDAVFERALAPLPEALRLAWPLLAPQGVFLAYQSDPPDLAQPELSRALTALGARHHSTRPYTLPREDRARHLAAFVPLEFQG